MPIIWNPADKNSSLVLSNGNLTATNSGGGYQAVRGNISKSAGQWQFEVIPSASSNLGNDMIGVENNSASLSSFPGADNNGWSWEGDGYKHHTSAPAYGANWAIGHVIGVCLDLDLGTLTYYYDGVSQGVAYSGVSGTLFAAISMYQSGDQFTANFGATAFTFPISGYSGFDTPPATGRLFAFFKEKIRLATDREIRRFGYRRPVEVWTY